ncbi:MAG: glycosyltransferase family 1 protein [Lachnospiraceae bacterium]|nr:glycosyltransferase family 1 protein [Lachnospiraceae bacterium]
MEHPMIVLHVVGKLNRGGAESRIMDLYRNIDREKVQFYFCQHTKERCAFEEEIEQLGGKIFRIPRFTVKNYFAYKRAWKELFLKNPEIRAVHGHMTSTASIYLPIAKKSGIPMTIAHARSAGVDPGIKGKITRLLRRNLYQRCDYRFTCSQLAGEAVFGDQKKAEKKAVMIPNAIEVEKFAFDENMRNRIRKELGVADKFIIGHVGRFSHMKNHKYMLQILEECIRLEKEKKLPETILMFLGEGELQEEIREQAVAMGLSSRVMFMGNQKEVWQYYQAMDYFLLPSFYEGLPGTAIEAQASGLPGILSDTVTGEAVITELLQRRSIKEKPSLWAREILEKSRKAYDRSSYAEIVKEAAFDVKEQAKRLQTFYLSGNLEEC